MRSETRIVGASSRNCLTSAFVSGAPFLFSPWSSVAARLGTNQNTSGSSRSGLLRLGARFRMDRRTMLPEAVTTTIDRSLGGVGPWVG
jgi:hypothetical protein